MTPEEIKKGLELCEADECDEEHNTSCPYVENVFCIAHLCGDALAYITKLESRVPKWISVNDRLPENYEPVIIFRDDCCDACFGWLIDGLWSVPKGVAVTHWMPIPEPPKEE